MTLHKAVEQYIALKRSLGFRFRAQSYILRAFRRAMGPVRANRVRPAAARAFLDGHGPVTRSWTLKWGTLREFYRYAVDRDLAHQSPLPTRPPKVVQTFTPHIYTRQELQRLLRVITPERTKSLSPETMRTLILLLYGAGLRLSEALNLEDSHVNIRERLLSVQRRKFFKSRFVPIGPKLANALEEYQRNRPSANGATRWFFRTKRGCHLDWSMVGKVFRGLREAAGVKRRDGGFDQPRLHDLRHSMATHCLINWYRQGANVQLLLPQLSAYLGHAEVTDTQLYLTMTPELRKQASDRFAAYALGGDRE